MYMLKWGGNRNTLRTPIHCNRGGIACNTRGGDVGFSDGDIVYHGVIQPPFDALYQATVTHCMRLPSYIVSAPP